VLNPSGPPVLVEFRLKSASLISASVTKVMILHASVLLILGRPRDGIKEMSMVSVLSFIEWWKKSRKALLIFGALVWSVPCISVMSVIFTFAWLMIPVIIYCQFGPQAGTFYNT
jgi:hypothetical protein